MKNGHDLPLQLKFNTNYGAKCDYDLGIRCH